MRRATVLFVVIRTGSRQARAALKQCRQPGVADAEAVGHSCAVGQAGGQGAWGKSSTNIQGGQVSPQHVALPLDEESHSRPAVSLQQTRLEMRLANAMYEPAKSLEEKPPPLGRLEPLTPT